jgi:plastocyanin
MIASLAFVIALSASAPYLGTEFQGGGTISGKITYNGQPPPRPRLSITMDRQYCGASREDDTWLVGADGGVRNVVVFLSDIATGKKMTAAPKLVLNQIGCRYVPRISIVPVDTQMEVKSSDPVLHNVHTYRDGTTLINFAVPPKQNFSITRKLDKTGGMKLKCDVHPFMRGAIFVAANPYVAITGEDGSYEIPDVPPGTYTINTWHEMAGGISQRVTVPDNTKVVWSAKLK